MRFLTPAWLSAVILILPVVFLWHKYLLSPGVARITRTVIYLRCAAMLSLILALAGAQWMVRQKVRICSFLVDVSESITSSERSQSMELVRHAARQLGRNDRAGLIAFAGEAFVDQPLGSDLSHLRQIESRPTRSETDLQAALQVALAHADPQRNLRLMIISDGVNTRGDVESLLPSLKSRGIPVDALLVGSLPESEVSVESVTAPGLRAGKPTVYPPSGHRRHAACHRQTVARTQR